MNLLLISNGNLQYDGRLRELLDVANRVGNTVSITSGSEEETQNKYIYKGKTYSGFIKYCLQKSKELSDIDILIVDNRKAVIPALILRNTLKPKCIVQDVRELYLIDEVKHFVGKVGCIVEKYLIKRADLLLCANSYRADIMKEYYKLSTIPTVFENFRMLSFTENYNETEYDEKYAKLLANDNFKLISTSGCSVFRTNDKLVLEMLECKHNVQLFLVGENSVDDEECIREIIRNNNLSNVHIIGRLKEDELKYLISKCDVGVVNYGMQDKNNIFCASGKIFEFLFEGKPVITTSNPPLKQLCENEGIGVSSESYSKAIDTVIDEYDVFKKAVMEYVSTIDISKNNQLVADKIKDTYLGKKVI